MKMPTQAATRPGELTDEDMALLKQGVGDKTGRPPQAGQAPSEGASDVQAEQIGSIVTYFEEKGFGFLRPESGGRDVFFHISRLTEGQASDLTPGTKVIYELGMDRTGKMAASAVKLAPPAEKGPPVEKAASADKVPTPAKAPSPEKQA